MELCLLLLITIRECRCRPISKPIFTVTDQLISLLSLPSFNAIHERGVLRTTPPSSKWPFPLQGDAIACGAQGNVEAAVALSRKQLLHCRGRSCCPCGGLRCYLWRIVGHPVFTDLSRDGMNEVYHTCTPAPAAARVAP